MLRLALIAALCTAAAAVPAAASVFGDDGGRALASGGSDVARCDQTQTVEYATQGGEVTSVTVGGIADPSCEGGRLSVTLTSAGAAVASGGPVAIPVDADLADESVTVPVAPAVPATQVDSTDVLVEDGP